MSPRTSSGQASWPYKMVPIGTILSPSEGGRKPQGENHQALAVKSERHPTCRGNHVWKITLIFTPFIYKIVHSLSQYNVHVCT